MDYNKIDKHIKNDNLNNLYLFYGPEDYLKNFYKDEIIKRVKNDYGQNIEIIKIAEKFQADSIMEIYDTVPMFSEKKILVVKNSNVFSLGKEQAEKYMFLSDVPEHCIAIFLEESVNRSRKLYKSFDKNGVCVNFDYLDFASMKLWVKKHVTNAGLSMNDSTIQYFINACEPDLFNISNELNKLIEYKSGQNNNIITNEEVDLLVTKALKSKVFALTDAIAEKNSDNALNILYELEQMKEPLQRVFFMICRYFRLCNRTKELATERYNKEEIEKIIKVKPYEGYKFFAQSKQFSSEELYNSVMDCTEFDIGIKSGKIDVKTACEILILKYSKRH